MANEFIARNGIFAIGNSQVTGSLNISAGITGSLLGTASTASYVVNTVTGTNSADLVYGNMADNDQFRIRIGGTATNAGFAEIATADDGTEPIHVRQYSGVFSSLVRTATLLDGSGNSSFPGGVTATSFTGSLFGTASFATSASRAISASYAPSSPAFPYVGAAVITGSLVVSGSNGGIDTINGVLSNPGSITKVDWISALLNTTAGVTTVDWENKALYDNASGVSIDWENRILYETTNAYEALNYSNSTSVSSQLYYNNTISAQVQRELANNPTYAGQTIQASISSSAVDYNLVALDTDGVWKPTNATVGYYADKMLGIAVDVDGGSVLIEGDIGVSDDNSQGAYVINADLGLPVYISANAGRMTTTAPSGAGSIVRIVGHIYYQSSTDVNWWTMKFRPSNDWYEI